MSVYRVNAFLNWGAWVAKCPRCSSAEKAGTCDDGTVGGLERKRFTCRESHGGCGLVCDVEWPEGLGEIMIITNERSKPMRNWLPGETLEDLRAENRAHGLTIGAAIQSGRL